MLNITITKVIYVCVYWLRACERVVCARKRAWICIWRYICMWRIWNIL